ncbi:MAG: helix-turn-helix domain-containing protein [Patescibacteria group bacterium]
MARFEDRRKAIELRLTGQTYSSIRTKLNVNKSTLSDWLKNIQLSKEQLEKISSDTIARRVETYINTTRIRRQKISEAFYKDQKKKLLPLSKRDFLIAGLFLYLGEGAKSDRSRIQITNSDPAIIRFSIFWINKILGIQKEKLRVQLHLYKDMDIENEIKFWLDETSLKREQVIKPYIKKTSSLKINHPSFGHGTCSVYCHDAILKDEFMAGIRVIMDSAMGV